MMDSKLLIFFFFVSIFFALVLTPSTFQKSFFFFTATEAESDNSQAFQFEIDELNSRIQSLESLVDKKNEELKSKDEMIAQKETEIAEKEKIINEMLDRITSLQSDVPSLKSYAESQWNEHGKPAFEYLKHKMLEKKAQAEKWTEPHVQSIKTNPQVQSLSEKTKEVYTLSRRFIRMKKVEEVVDPHFQTVKKVSKPYIDRIVSAIKPRLDKAWETVASS